MFTDLDSWCMTGTLGLEEPSLWRKKNPLISPENGPMSSVQWLFLVISKGGRGGKLAELQTVFFIASHPKLVPLPLLPNPVATSLNSLESLGADC